MTSELAGTSLDRKNNLLAIQEAIEVIEPTPPISPTDENATCSETKGPLPSQDLQLHHLREHHSWWRWVQAFACSLIFMNNWGLASGFGVYQAYYQLPDTDRSLAKQGSSQADISWIGTTQASFTLIFGVLSGPLFDRGWFRSVIVLASILMSISFMLLSFCSRYWQILLVQGIMQGVCSGMLYIPSISVIPRHFSSNRGTALGLVTAGAPLGGILYPITLRYLIDKYEFEWTTRIVGFMVLGTLGIACSLLRQAPRQEPPARRISLRSLVNSLPYLSFLAASFLLFCGMLVPYIFCAIYSVTIIDGVSRDAFYRPQGSEINEWSSELPAGLADSKNKAFYTVVILNAANILGRLLPATLSDLGWPAEIMLGISTTLMGGLAFWWIFITTRNLYIIFLVFYGFFTGTLATLPAIALHYLCPDVSTFATRLGLVYLFAGLGVLVGSPVAALLNNLSPEARPYLFSQIWVGITMLSGSLFVGYSGYHIRNIRKSRAIGN